MLALPAAKGSVKKINSSSIVKSGGTLSTPFKVNKKRINVASTTLMLQEKQKEKAYKEQKKEVFKAADKGEKIRTEKLLEAEPEKKLKPGLKLDAPSIKTPGFFDRIFKFVLYTALGWLIGKISDQNSIINKIFKTINELLGNFIEWFPKFLDATYKFFEIVGPPLLKFGGMLFDGITGAIDLGYSTYEKIRGNVNEKQGEEASKKLDSFVDGINKFIDGALIFGTAMLLFGDDLIPDLPGSDVGDDLSKPGKPGTKPYTKSTTAEKLKNSRIRRIQREYGPGSRKIYENALNNGKSPAQAEAAVRRGFKKGVSFRPGADSLASRTAPKGSILKGFGQRGLRKGIDKATQRFFLKIVGMGGVKVLKGILNKIPVIGPLITFALNWASGESIARSGAMAVGSGLGQMLGTWAGGALGVLGGPLAPVTVPLGGFVGNVLGSIGGELLGGFLFDLVTGKKQKPGEVFSSAIATIRKFFEKDFQNVVKGFLGWIGNTIVSGANGLWNALTSMAKFIGGLDFFKALGKATNDIRYSLKKLWEKKGDIFNPLKIIGYIGTIRSVLGELFKIMVFPGLGKFLYDNALIPFFNSIGDLWKNKDKFFNFLMNSMKSAGSFVMKEGTFQDITGAPDLSLSEGIEALNTGGRVKKDTKRTAPTSGSTKTGESPLSGSNAVITAAKRAVSSGKRGPATPPCASWVRMVLGMAGHPAARKTTKVGDLDPVGTTYSGPNYAASFAGSDMGTVIKSQGSLIPGDIVLHKNTYGNYASGSITHVSIASDTKGKVLHQPTSGGPPKEGGIFKFAAGIRLGGTGSIGFSDQDGSGSGGGGVDTGSGGGFTSPIMALANLLEEMQKTTGSSTSTSGQNEVKKLVKTLDPERSTSSSFSGVPSKSTSGLKELTQMLSYNEPEPNTQLIFVTKETYIK